MRLLLSFVCIILTCSAPLFAQGWEWLNPLPLGNTLIDLDYVGPGQLVSNGYYGAVIGSSDNGVSWSIREQANRIWPEKVEFVGGAVGWGLCDEYGGGGGTAANTIYRTTDLGATWQVRYHHDGINLDDCSFLSADYGFAVGYVDSSYRMFVAKTTDGGETWTETVSDSDGSHGKIFFLNEQEGWISEFRATWHTTDGGASWQWAYSPYWMYFDLVFLDGQNGWGLSFHEAYKTSDAGQTWTTVYLPTDDTEMSHSIAVIDPNTIWICTSTDDAHHRYDHLLYTTNGGQTWTRDSLDTTSDLQKIVFADALHGWTCGENGTLYETANGGATWTRRCGNQLAAEYPGYLDAVDFADRQNGWMVKSEYNVAGPILHSSDAGTTWSVQFYSPVVHIYDIEAVSTTNVWAAGSELLHTTDGGLNWEQVETGDDGWYWQIICDGEQIIWLASASDNPMRVHRSIDGGATWQTHEVELDWKFNGMAASGPNDVWFTSWADLDDGWVAHSDDGGETWESQADSLGYLTGIYFVDPLHGWASAWTGIVRTEDGGDHWTLANDSVFGVELIQFLDLQNGWAYGDVPYRTTDGGETWEHFSTYMDSRVQGADFVDPTHGWVVAWNDLLRFDGSIFAAPEAPTPAPAAFAFLPAYPNPFNSSTTLRFQLPAAGRTRIELFDLTGRLVEILADRSFLAGQHTIPFAADELPSGIYFARATVHSTHAVQKLILLK